MKSTCIIVAILAFALTACTAGNQTSSDGQASQSKTESLSMEKISNAVYDGESITVTVMSNGCTQASHFVVEHNVIGDRCELTVVRTQPDRCRRAPTPITVGIVWSAPADCAAVPLYFTNPLLQTRNRSLGRQLNTD